MTEKVEALSCLSGTSQPGYAEDWGPLSRMGNARGWGVHAQGAPFPGGLNKRLALGRWRRTRVLHSVSLDRSQATLLRALVRSS